MQSYIRIRIFTEVIIMKIIIVGIGKVGYVVAQELAAEKHDVTVIDTNETVIGDAMSRIDVIGVNGDGTTCSVLTQAGVESCELLIALTNSDEVNLLCCLLAKQMGAKSTVARVRTPHYNDELELIKDSLGLSMTVNPERDAADEILRILKFPAAMNVESFAKGKCYLASFVADENCRLCGKAIKESFAGKDDSALVCAVRRGSEVVIPTGDYVIKCGDTVAVLAKPYEIDSFFESAGIKVNDVNSAVIVGGGRISHYLIGELNKRRVRTIIIERDRKRSEDLAYVFPHSDIICADGTSRSVLSEIGLDNVDSICCLTGIDEENILLSLYAKSAAPAIKTITKINKIDFEEVVKNLDIGSVVYPKNSSANRILQYVRARQNVIGSGVETLYRIIDNKVEALSFSVGADCRLLGSTLRELKIKSGILVGCIERGGHVFIPHGQDKLEAGDSVVIVTTIAGLTDLEDILE